MRQVVALTSAVVFVLIVVYLRTRGVRRRGTAKRKRFFEDPWSNDEASDLVELIEFLSWR
jgi:hypothetical protein